MRPRVLAVLPGLFPSTIINVAKPLLRLHAERRIDLTLTFQFVVRRRQVEDTDVLVLCHTIDPQHTHILDSARDLATPLIYDIDENLLEPPPDEPGLEFHAAPARQAAVRRCLEQAALVRTYSPVLKRTLDRFNPEVMRVDGPVDWTLISGQARPQSARTHIVYATSRVDDLIGRALVGPLQQIVAAHPNVDVTIWGPRLAGLDRHPRVQHRGFIRDYDQYFKEFADAGFDIGLAPMPTDLFYQCKTATKFREYAACRIAGVYSDVEMYRDCVTEGVTGLLVPSGDAGWAAAIGRLIDDDALRRGIQERGEAYARDRYGPGRMEVVWLSGIEQVMRRRDTSGAHVHPARVDFGRADRVGLTDGDCRRVVSAGAASCRASPGGAARRRNGCVVGAHARSGDFGPPADRLAACAAPDGAALRRADRTGRLREESGVIETVAGEPAVDSTLDLRDVRVGQVRGAFRDVVRSARLWHIWVRLGVQDVRHKFRRSTVGPAWIFLNLGVMIAAIGVIYGRLLGQDMHQFIPYLTAGLIIWGYLTTSMSEGAHAFVNSEGYIKQIALPIYVYVFRCFTNVGLTTAISFSVFAIVALFYRVPIGVGTLWVLPGAIALMAVSLLIICILAHLHARFRDVGPMAGVGMQMAFYVTPVMFPGELLRSRHLGWAIDFNPFYHLVEVVRRPLVSAQPAARVSYLATALVLVVLTAAAAGIVAHYRRRIVFVL